MVVSAYGCQRSPSIAGKYIQKTVIDQIFIRPVISPINTHLRLRIKCDVQCLKIYSAASQTCFWHRSPGLHHLSSPKRVLFAGHYVFLCFCRKHTTAKNEQGAWMGFWGGFIRDWFPSYLTGILHSGEDLATS